MRDNANKAPLFSFIIDLTMRLTPLNYFCTLLDPQAHKRLTEKKGDKRPWWLAPFRNESTGWHKACLPGWHTTMMGSQDTDSPRAHTADKT